MLCYRCHGTGIYFGNGMMKADCDKCDGFGTLLSQDELAQIENKGTRIDKRSKEYKKAIKDIMDLDNKITRDEAEKMFQNTYDNV